MVTEPFELPLLTGEVKKHLRCAERYPLELAGNMNGSSERSRSGGGDRTLGQ